MPASDTRILFETYARGKLLLTGEYAVLDGAPALAVPVRFGQSLHVEAGKTPASLSWTSKDEKGDPWFLADYELPGIHPVSFTEKRTAEILASVLQACRQQAPGFLAENSSCRVLAQTDFPRGWGLGTSSTLVAAVARWAGVNPYPVLFDTFGGSGYDLACAYAKGPVLYRLHGRVPEIREIAFHPPFAGALYFVYLSKKQDSRAAIRHYREHAQGKGSLIDRIGRLTAQFLAAQTLTDLEAVIREHEQCIGEALDLPRAKTLYFHDYWGEIKSLGAWGGDFVLATSNCPEAETRAYFSQKGFDTLINWENMVYSVSLAP